MQIDRLNKIKSKTCSMQALYVEDDERVRKQTANILGLFFSRVFVYDSAILALEKFKSSAIDVVFTDIHMPHMNGLEMIEQIKNINPDIKTFIFSAYDKPEFFTKAITLGVDMYILKPFSSEDIMNALEKVSQNENNNINDKIYLNKEFFWDSKKSNLYKNGTYIKLTKNEIALLELLINSKNQIVSSYDIENELFYKDSDENDNKRLRNIIYHLNKKVGYQLIENIYSQGYKIKCV